MNYSMRLYGYFALLLGLLACSSEPAVKADTSNPPTAEGYVTDDQGFSAAGYALSPVPGTDLKLAEKWNADGQILESGTVIDGQKHGGWSYFAPGKYSPTKTENYERGRLNGPCLEFDAVGRLVKIVHYQNGQLHGRYAEFRASHPQVTASYRNGELHGTYRMHTLQNGRVNRSIEYKDGKEDGPMRWYNDAGELIQERQYRAGELVD